MGRNAMRPMTFELDDLSIPRNESSQYWEEVSTPFLDRGDPNAWASGYMLMMEPLAPGDHAVHRQFSFQGTVNTLNAKLNVFELATESLTVGQPYTQNFDSLGSDGVEGTALPNAWTVTDENAFNIYQHETAASFPLTTTTAQGTYPYAMSAGIPGESDRRFPSTLSATATLSATNPTRASCSSWRMPTAGPIHCKSSLISKPGMPAQALGHQIQAKRPLT